MSRISCAHILTSKMCFNVEFSTYYFQMKEKVLADVQIYIRVPLMKCCSFNGQRQNSENLNWSTAWTVSKEGVFSGLYFPAFGLNTERYSYLDTFHAVEHAQNRLELRNYSPLTNPTLTWWRTFKNEVGDRCVN